ncbi:Mu transposase C-terminal domain-containing protein [Streptomyces sp. NPDC051173]|uniref:Mu transposase C-terminal domain-containing protein n=1 Tax=Streptomyces sp. NPDC051173 TaxID=3155164 RepID=UPI00344E4BD5
MSGSCPPTPHPNPPVLAARLGRAAAVPRLIALDQHNQLLTAHVKLAAHALGRSERTVWRWLAEARNTGRHTPLPRTRFTITPEIRRLLALWGGNASAVHRELRQRAAADPRLKVPSLATLHRALRRDLTRGERAGLAHGEAARRAHDVFGERPPTERNAAWEGDHKCVPVQVQLEDELVQPWVTWFIDCATRVITGVAVTPHAPSTDAVLAALRTALDRTGTFGPAGGLPGLVRVDRGKDYLSAAVNSALGALVVPVVDLPPYTPHLKGSIEALNRAVEEMLFVSLPRYTRQPKLTGKRTADPDAPALTFEAFVKLLLDWVKWWNTEHKPKRLAGRTPMEAWRADPTPVYDVPAEQLAFFGLQDDGRTRTISTHGVQWRNRHYIAAWMVGLVGTRVILRYLPHHETSIEVFDLHGAHLGPAFLAGAATPEQVRQVRGARTAKARRLRADAKAAAKLRRERFEAVTTAAPPQRLQALTELEAETELSSAATMDLSRLANPGYIPHRPPFDDWARPLPPKTAPNHPDVLQEDA